MFPKDKLQKQIIKISRYNSGELRFEIKKNKIKFKIHEFGI